MPADEAGRHVKWEHRPVPTRPLAIAVGIALAACCLCCGPVILTLGPSELLARRLAPPIYPGSVQVSHYQSEGPDSRWEESVHHTSDNIRTVLAFYEALMPGFIEDHNPSDGKISYFNGRSDNGPLGIMASWAVGGNARPGAGIVIFEDQAQSGVTVIEMRIDWPAQ
jgi:hypothetical protein